MDNLTLGYLLIGIGMLVMAGELFFPAHGTLVTIGVCLDLAGVAVVFVFGGSTTGFITLAAVCIAIPIFGAAIMYLWPRTPLGKRLMIRPEDHDATIATMPVLVELEQLRGRIGKASSALRPAGIAEFDGQRVDVMSEGMLIEPGTWVRCIDVKAGRVIVRPVEDPRVTEYHPHDFR